MVPLQESLLRERSSPQYSGRGSVCAAWNMGFGCSIESRFVIVWGGVDLVSLTIFVIQREQVSLCLPETILLESFEAELL